MAGPDSRWGSDRTRRRLVSIVMFVVLAVLLALAWAMSRSRAPEAGLGTGAVLRVGPVDARDAPGSPIMATLESPLRLKQGVG